MRPRTGGYLSGPERGRWTESWPKLGQPLWRGVQSAALMMHDQELGTNLETTKMRCPDLASAKNKEQRGLRELDVFEECPRRECREVSGRVPLTRRWVEDRKPNGWRARLIVKGYLEPKDERQLTFATTAALANVRLVLAHEAQNNEWETNVADVSKAFLNAELKKCAGQADVFVEPPPEAKAAPGCLETKASLLRH